MMDLLPFPHITATEPKEQLSQLRDYLFQFKEELEFILSNLNENNLSQELIDKLNSLGADIDKTDDDSNDQLWQISSRTVTVSDVINSTAFDLALKSKIPTFSINFETGNLEY
jgi:hypothetical protein